MNQINEILGLLPIVLVICACVLIYQERKNKFELSRFEIKERVQSGAEIDKLREEMKEELQDCKIKLNALSMRAGFKGL